MSLLGSEFDIKGFSIRPFYLILGLLSLSTLLICLGLVYVFLVFKNTLGNVINELRADRDKWLNKK